MTKRIFAISTLVLILLVGAIFVYNFAFKAPEMKKDTTQQKTAEEGKTALSAKTKEPDNQTAKQSNENSITAVSNELVFGAALAPSGNSIYYFSGKNGQLNQIDFDGKLEKVVSTEEFQNIQKIIWNKPKNKAIIKRKDGADKSKFLLLDLAQKSVLPLKDNIDSVAWSGMGDKIIYKYYDAKTKKRTLEISDPDGNNWRKIADIGFFSVEISAIPGSSEISFWPSPEAHTSSIVSAVNFSGENKKEILKDRWGVDILWSPDGKSAAVSHIDQKGGHQADLALINSDGGQFRALAFPSFVRKCAWSADSKYLFCALPGNIPETATLPNDWLEGKIVTSDTFWKIEVSSGKKERLIEVDKINGSFDVLNPFLSADEKTFFFTNKADGKLYKVQL